MNKKLLAIIVAGVVAYNNPQWFKKPDVAPNPSPSPSPRPVPPAPTPKPKPKPCPGPGPCPNNPDDDPYRNPLAPGPHPYDVSDKIGGPELDGTEAAIDLPGSQHLKNKGGSDGAGLCVFTSIDMASNWQNVQATLGFRDYMTKFPGGGYPEKVDQYIKKICTERNVPIPRYVQITNGDMSMLDLAIKTGRMPCVTYGYSPRYGSNISHMVCLAHLDEKNAMILDNNFPGDDKYEWIERDEFKKRWLMQHGGWAFILLDPPPPPIPVN